MNFTAAASNPKRKLALLVFLALLSFSNAHAQPVINSFSPAAAHVGETITINGSNFNATPAANIVYFGGVKATVVTASSTAITALVPAGASYQPITVTTGGFTAYSRNKFSLRSPNAGYPFTASSFDYNVQSYATIYSTEITAADFDVDGKPDLLTLNPASANVSVIKNTSTPGKISFASRVHFSAGSPTDMAIADLNGDGKPDIVVTNSFSSTLSVLINTTSNGLLSFANRVVFAAGLGQANVVVRDFDGDGRTDIAVLNNLSQSIQVSVVRNTSSGSTLSFAQPVAYLMESPNSNLYTDLVVDDLDGDGKPDLAGTIDFRNTLFAIRNLSTPGNLSFAPKVSFTTGTRPMELSSGDLNGDGLPDLVTANNTAGSVSVFQNTSTVGTIDFSVRNDLAFQTSPMNAQGGTIADIDGDAYPDIAAVASTEMGLFKNRGAGGAIAMLPKAGYPLTSGRKVTACDLDGDGKTDLAVTNPIEINIGIFRNKQPSSLELCPGGSATIQSAAAGSTYQWQISTDSVSFTNLTPNANYGGTQSSALQLINLPSANYGAQYRCVVDGVTGDPFLIKFVNRWTGAVDNAWENPANWSCGAVPDNNTSVVISSGQVVVNSTIVVRSLLVGQGASFTVSSGYTVTVTH